jgi:hypothetical protein
MGPDSRFQVSRSPVAKSAYWMATVAIQLAVFASLASSPTIAPKASSAATPQPTPSAKNDNGITVLFLGDSLSLCGFGKHLDERLRQMPGVKSVYSYMCCATQPLSWLKASPYSNVKTRCGFWSIESVPDSAQPKQIEDVYGMRRGSVPKVHPVPKLEDLLARFRPDVLVMQTGGNLFDLFPDHKTVRPERDGSELRKFVFPFVSKAISRESSLKKIYWVASPVSGRVSQHIQDFVVEQVRGYFGAAATVIDSRPLVAYPYHHMERDREHFIGEDMDEWADKVFGIVSQDLSMQSVASLKPLGELFPQIAAAAPTPTPAVVASEGQLNVTARLVFKSKPMRVDEFLPYQESMVGFVYDVRKVSAGEYDEPQILVLHPAYIGLKKQSLHKYRIGKTYKLRLRELAGTAWSTVKRRDDSGRIDLQPYIQVEDEAKYPGTTRTN